MGFPFIFACMHEMFWRIESFPELSHLAPADRKRLVQSSVGRLFQVALLLNCTVVGGVLGTLSGLLIASMLGIAGTTMAVVLALVAAPVGMVLMFQLNLIRMRGELRIYLEQVAQTQRLPMCLNCGYDHQGLTSDVCPECGKPLPSPRNGSPDI